MKRKPGEGGDTSATMRVNTPTPAPQESAAALQQRLVQETNAALIKLVGTHDIENGTFPFEFPFADGADIKTASCSWSKNTIKIGDNTYELQLPAGAQAKTVAIEGSTTNGSATLTGKLFFVEKSETMPLIDLVQILETLRSQPKDHSFTRGSNQLEFKLRPSAVV